MKEPFQEVRDLQHQHSSENTPAMVRGSDLIRKIVPAEIRAWAAVISSALLLGAVPVAAQGPTSQEKVVQVPLPGVVRTVSVGSTVLEKSRLYVVEESVTTVVEPMKGGQWMIPLTINPDQPLTEVSSKAKFKACAGIGGSGACGLDDDGDGIFDRMARDDISMALRLKKPVRYVTRRETTVQADKDNFRQVILYTGATGDTLRLSYREFVKDMARAAFTEELTIPLTRTFPQMVAVKDVQFRIHGIDGMGLRYEIVVTQGSAERG